MAKDVIVHVIADPAGFKKGMASASASARDFEGRVKGLRSHLISLGGAFGLISAAGVAGVFTQIVKAAAETQKVTAQTNAVLRSTGQVAGVTAKQVDNLGKALQRKTTFDDEAVRSGENLLLTFTNIRNVAGKNNDIFNQATKATLDLSTAFNKDMASSAILVGKALNDPIKGLTALQRVGVQFTEQQRQQIKTMIAHNDVIGAQKIILAELAKETGGSAAAAANTFGGRMKQLKNQVQEVEESIGTLLLPTLTKYARALTDWLSKSENQKKITDAVRTAMHTLGEVLKALKATFDAIWPVVKTVVDLMGGWKNTILAIIALKFAVTVSGWAGALASFAAPGGGLERAKLGSKALLTNMKALAAMPAVRLVVSYLVVQKIVDAILPGKQGKDFSDPTDPSSFTKARGRVVTQQGGGSVYVDPQGTAHRISDAKPVQPAAARGMRATHQTRNLPGYPAVDIMAKPHTRVLAPADGEIIRISGHDPAEGAKGDIYGWSIYYKTAGATYFLTHLEWTAPIGSYRAGAVIGLVADWGGRSHVHVGVNTSGSGAAKPATVGAAPPTSGAATASPKRSVASVTSVTSARNSAQTFAGTVRATITALGSEGLPPDLLAKLRKQWQGLDAAIADAADKSGIAKAQAALKRFAAKVKLLGRDSPVRSAISSLIEAGGAAGMVKQLKEQLRAVDDAVLAADPSDSKLLERLSQRYDQLVARAKNLIKRSTIANDVKDWLASFRASMAEWLTGVTGQEVLDPAQLEKTRASVVRWQHELQSLQKTLLFDKAILSDDQVAKIQARIGKVQALLDGAKTSYQATFEEIKSRLGDRLSAFVGVALDAFDKQTNGRLDVMRKAFSAQMKAFDRETQKGLDAIRARFSAATPSELALQQLRAAHDAQQQAKDLADAQQELATATVSGDPARIRDAQARLAEIQYQEQERALETRAQQERDARDKEMAAAVDAYQEQRDALRESLDEQEALREQRYQEERDAEKKRFGERLAALDEQLANGKISWDTYQKDVLALFQEYEVPFRESGSNAALAFIQGAYSEFEEAYRAGQKMLAAFQAGAAGSGIPNFGSAPSTKTVTVPGKTGGSSYIPYHPGLASGGIVMREMLARIGERGPEAVVPLDKYRSMMGGGTPTPTVINIHVDNFFGGEDELMNAVKRGMADYMRRNGGSSIIQAP